MPLTRDPPAIAKPLVYLYSFCRSIWEHTFPEWTSWPTDIDLWPMTSPGTLVMPLPYVWKAWNLYTLTFIRYGKTQNRDIGSHSPRSVTVQPGHRKWLFSRLLSTCWTFSTIVRLSGQFSFTSITASVIVAYTTSITAGVATIRAFDYVSSTPRHCEKFALNTMCAVVWSEECHLGHQTDLTHTRIGEWNRVIGPVLYRQL